MFSLRKTFDGAWGTAEGARWVVDGRFEVLVHADDRATDATFPIQQYVRASVFEDGLVRWAKIPSTFAALRLAGAGLTVAYAAQIAIGVCIAATVALVWWRRPPLPLRAATLVAGTLAATPYLFDYDFALLAIPIALIAMGGYLRGWKAGERPVLVIAWVMPLVSTGVAEWTNVQIGPACVLALFVIAARRAFAAQDRQRRTPVPSPMENAV